MLEDLKAKIFLLIGRGVLKALDASGKMQTVQVSGLKSEIISDIERPQPYGLETYPEAGTEAIIIFPNGNRDQGLAIIINDRDNKPEDLSEGDVHVWSNADLVLNTGDAALWKPNVLTADPMTGIPHGGAEAGIIKLKGK